jgi:hypothetical protein
MLIAMLGLAWLLHSVQRNFFPEPWQILQEEDRLLKKRHIKSSSKNYGSLSGTLSESTTLPLRVCGVCDVCVRCVRCVRVLTRACVVPPYRI